MEKAQNKTLLGICLGLLILCCFNYGRSLYLPFMVDDFGFLAQEKIRTFFVTFSDFFTKSPDQHYAPLYYLLNVNLFFLYHNPFPFHLINLVLFYLNCLLLFWFVSLISGNRKLALLTSVFFCIHPINTETVNHITLNIVLVHALFMELSLITFCLSLKTKKTNYLQFLSYFFFVGALLSHELSLLLPVYIVCILYLIKGRSFKESLKQSLAYWFLSCLYFFMWLSVAGKSAGLLERFNVLNMDFGVYWANFFHLIKWVISSYLTSQNIVFMQSLALKKEGIWFDNFFLVGILAIIFVLIGKFWKKSLKTFALTVFLTGFLIAVPASLGHPHMGLVVEPYWFYFSSIGFFLLVSLGLLKLHRSIRRKIFMTLICSICLFLFIQTQQYHTISQTELSYAENWLEKSPNNTIPMMILATLYSYSEAGIPSSFMNQMLQMVDLYTRTNTDQRAIDLLRKILSYDFPSLREQNRLQSKLAALYFKNGEKEKSRGIIEAILRSQTDAFSYLQLSDAFNNLGISKEAIGLLERCQEKYPVFSEAYLLEGIIWANIGDYNEAIALWKKGSQINPNDSRFVYSIKKAQELMVLSE